jgi:predicted nucleic acid-binding protein
MIILDSNILSEFMHDRPDLNVINWLDRQPRTSVWTTSISVFEIRFGLQTMPMGKRQTSLEPVMKFAPR